MSSKFGRIRPWTTELAAHEHMKKIPNRLIIGKKDVITFSPIFLAHLSQRLTGELIV